MQLRDSKLSLTVLGKKKAWIVPAFVWAGICSKLAVDVDVLKNAMPVRIVRSDAPEIR